MMVPIWACTAASTFSLSPPMGRTLPRRVISPVIATSLLTCRPERAEIRAVAMVTPALGPSLGMAPAGTWTWMSRFSRKSRVDAQLVGVGAGVGEGGLGALLHHLAEVAGQGQIPLALHGG